MALVLSNQENIDLLLFWLKLAVGICCVAIAALVFFWLRLKNLEKRLSGLKIASRFSQQNAQGNRPQNLSHYVYQRSPHKLYKKLYKKFSRDHRLPTRRDWGSRSLWRWLLVIGSVMGLAIAFGNGFVSSEVTTFLWLAIGVILVLVAAISE